MLIINNIDNLIIEHCIKYTRYIIDLIKPKFVYIMIDGVAPRAKINQQRERRYKSYFYKKYLNNSDSNNTANNQWDSNKITPGTNFMKQLNYHLINFKKSMQLVNNVVIEISDSNDIGEGEHKMMKIISNNYDKNSNKKIPRFSHLLPNQLVLKYKNPFIHGTLFVEKDVITDIGGYSEEFKYA